MRDEGEYAMAARIWSQGGLPYRDAFSQKPPVILLVYRAAFALWPERENGARRLAAAASLLIMMLLLALTPRNWRWSARLAAPAFFASSSTLPIGSLGMAANTEIFLCLWVCAAALSLSRMIESRHQARWALLCGLFLGGALMTKQTAIWTVAAFSALACWQLRACRMRILAALGLGAALIPGLFAAYFAYRGGLDSFVQACFLRNLDYSGLLAVHPGLGGHLSWFFGSVVPLFLRADWPSYALALWALWGVKVSSRDFLLLPTLWLGSSLVGAFTGLLLFPYYFLQAFPALALLASAGIERWSGRPRLALIMATGAALYPVFAHFRAYFSDIPPILAFRLLYPNPLFEAAHLGHVIRSRSDAGDLIYVYGSEAQVYVYARRDPATPHVMAYPLTLFPRQGDWQAEMARLALAKPRYVVYSTQLGSTIVSGPLGEAFQEAVRSWLERDYALIGFIEMGKGEFLPMRGSPGEYLDWDRPPSLLLFERIRASSSPSSG